MDPNPKNGKEARGTVCVLRPVLVPDVRVGIRQKACSQPACKRARKKDAQRKWCDKNPGYMISKEPSRITFT
jgi:hypothetical protein